MRVGHLARARHRNAHQLIWDGDPALAVPALRFMGVVPRTYRSAAGRGVSSPRPKSHAKRPSLPVMVQLMRTRLLLVVVAVCGSVVSASTSLAPATFVSSNVLKCTAPSQSASVDYLEVSPNHDVTQTSSGKTFTFYALPRVGRVSPSSGSVVGGTIVTVFGTNFLANSKCRFGSTVVSARNLSSSSVQCTSPAATGGTPGAVSVEISNNNVDYTSDAVTFTYYAAPVVSAVIPSAIPFHSGTLVTVIGYNFPNNQQQVTCRFRTDYVIGTYVNASIVTCEITPILAAGLPVYVALSFNGADYTSESSQAVLVQAPPVVISAVFPSSIASEGGTSVTVVGSGFLANGQARCVFDATRQVIPTFVNATVVRCTSPSLPGANRRFITLQVLNLLDLSLTEVHPVLVLHPAQIARVRPNMGPVAGGTVVNIYGLNFVSSSAATVSFGALGPVAAHVITSTWVRCLSPASGSPGSVAVEFANNAVNFTKSGVVFAYQPWPNITRMVPAFGSAYGGTPVTIWGNGFAQTDLLACRFGSVSAPAVFLNATCLTCVTPRQPMLLSIAHVNVSVSNNGADYLDQNVLFEFRPWNTNLTSVWPPSGPVSGGYSITVFGPGFRTGGGGYLCRFASAVVAATYVSSTSLRCSLPPAPSITVPSRVDASDNAFDFSSSSLTFQFYQQPTLYQVTPLYVSASGTPNVLLRGAGFPRQSTMTCRFNASTVVNATWLSSSWVNCPFPTGGASVGGVVPVEVSVNAIHYTSSGLSVTVENLPTLRALHPANGTGGTRVTITGSGFRFSADAACQFNTSSVKVRYMSTTQVICTSPSVMSYGTQLVSVSNNGQDFSSSLPFTYRLPSLVTGVFPTQLGIRSPNRNVLVYGVNFVRGETQCVFNGTIWQSAAYINATSVNCTVPPGVGGVGIVRVATGENGQQYSNVSAKVDMIFDIQLDGAAALSVNSGPVTGGTLVTLRGAFFSRQVTCRFGNVAVAGTLIDAQTVSCLSMAQAAQTVALELSNNNRDFTSFGRLFTYNPVATITSLTPSFGTISGGTVVTVAGTGFLLSGRLSCRFGSAIVHATFLSSTSLTCPAPAWSSYAAVVLTVSNNGQDVTNALTYTYSPLPVVSSVAPLSASSVVANNVTVTVTGANFIAGKWLTCRFGAVLANATFVSASTVLCLVPSAMKSAEAMTTLTIASNMVDFSSMRLLFNVTHPAVTTRLMTPTTVPYGRTTTITVIGDYFINSRYLACKFSSQAALVPATFLDQKTVLCALPAPSSGTNVTVAISNNGIEFTAPPLVVGLAPLAVVSYVAPTYATTSQLVTVVGANFVQSNYTACIVGWRQIVPAQFVNSTALLCMTPSRYQSAPVTFAVRNSQGEWSATSANVTLVNRPTITSLTPPTGVLAGGTLVDVWGADFRNDRAMCAFNDSLQAVHWVSATFVSSTHVQCTTPAAALGPAWVDLSFSGLSFTPPSWTTFTYARLPRVVSVLPGRASTLGGTPITVSGYLFLNSPNLRVRIDATLYTPVFVSSQELHVTTNAHGAGSYQVRVTNNLQEFSTDTVNVQFTTPITVASFTPVNVTWLGGTLVTITGAGFYNTSLAVCQFGTGTLAPAQIASTTTATCAAPFQPAGTTLSLALSLDGGGVFATLPKQVRFLETTIPTGISPTMGPAAGSSTVYLTVASGASTRFNTSVMSLSVQIGAGPDARYATPGFVNATAIRFVMPAMFPGTATISVADAADPNTFLSTGLSFRFYAPVRLASLWPPWGTVAGNTTVRVYGFNYLNSPYLTCLIGNRTAPATFISSTRVDIVTPPAVASGNVSVRVSLNGGVDYAPDVLYYRYVPAVSVTGIVQRIVFEQTPSALTVSGTSFPLTAALACAFNDVRVPAAFLNSTMIVCPAPRLPSTSSYTLSVVTSNNDVATLAAPMVTPEKRPTLSAVTLVSVSSANVSVFNATGAFPVFHVAPTCQIGPVRVPATSYSTTSVICQAGNLSPGLARFAIVSGESTLTEEPPDTFLIELFARPVVQSIKPTRGPVYGNTSVTVTGSGFVDAPYLSCSFGGALTLARYVSASTVSCITPPLALPANVSVQVANDAKAFSFAVSSSVFSQTVAVPVLVDANPKASPERGGLPITIRTVNASSSDVVTCVFAGVTVQSTFVNASALQCLSPALPAGYTTTLRVVLNSDANVTLTTPFTVYGDVVLTSVVPAWGTTSGGTQITLHGSGFVGTSQSCLFGSATQVAATIVTSSLATCTTPAHTSSGPVSLRMSNGIAGWTGASLVFRYVSTPVVTQIRPSVLVAGQGSGLILTVTGSGFETNATAASALQCLYMNSTNHTVASDALWVASTEIRCRIPEDPFRPTSMAVAVVAPGVSMSGPSIPVSVLDAMVITGTTPSYVAELSPTSVQLSIRGQRFNAVGSVACLLNGTSIGAATLATPTLVVCTIPALTARAPALAVQFADDVRGSPIIVVPVVPSPVVTGVSPSALDANVSSSVIVTGTFPTGYDMLCKFGSTSTVPTQVTSTSVTCPTPARSGLSGTVDLSLVLSFANATTGLQPVTLFSNGAASSARMLTPETALVYGSRFRDSPSLSCSFDDGFLTFTVTAVYLNATSILCRIPSTSLPSYNVTAGDASSPRIATPLSLPAQPTIASVSPSLVYDDGAPKSLTLTGTGFSAGAVLAVLVGDVTIAPAIVNTTAMHVTVTALSSPSTPISLLYPNGNQSEAIEIAVVPRPSITLVSPVGGSLWSSNQITVTGAGFTSTSFLQIGTNTTLPATFVSSTTLLCTIPVTPALVGARTLSVATGLPTSPFVPSAVTFTFFDIVLVNASMAFESASSGASVLTVLGAGFATTSIPFQCVLGSGALIAPATTLPTLAGVTCPLPAIPPRFGNVTVQIGINDGTVIVSRGSVQIDDIGDFSIRALSLAQRTLATTSMLGVYGRYDMASASVTCYFDTTAVPATVTNGTYLQCAIPTLGSTTVQGTFFISSIADGISMPSNQLALPAAIVEVQALSAAMSPSLSSVIVTTNGVIGASPACRLSRYDNRTAQVVVTASIIDTSHVSCPLPSALRGERVLVEISSVDSASRFAPFATVVRSPTAVTITGLQAYVPNGQQVDHVLVNGTGFLSTNASQCIFGSRVATTMHALSSTLARCDVPEAPPFRSLYATLSIGASASVNFSFIPPASILTTSTVSAASAYPTTLTFWGTNLLSSPSPIYCSMPNVSPVTARMVNNSQGTCLIPALPSGTTRITIAGAGLPVGSSAQQTALQTVDSSRLYSLSPSQAWQAAGGSASITVQGADFAPGAFCILQGVTPLSTLRLNSSALICTVPTTTPGRFALQVADPLYPAGSPSKLTFDVVPMPAAVPSSSTPLSTTYVTIVGTAFPQSSPVLCKFDDAPASPGFVLNATALVCQVPSASQAYGNATSVSLSIDNGATFRQLVAPWTTRTFPYATSDPVLAGVSPSWMIAGVPSKVVVYAAPLVSLSSHMTLSCLILPGTATPGTLLNGTAVDCGALVLFATSTVTIVIDNWYQLASTLAVSVYNQPVVSGVTPATLAWTGASASVTLTGANLLFPQCQCKFIAANLSTSWVTSPTSQTSRQVVCPVPGAIAPGASPVLVAVTDALQRFLSESPVALQVFAQQPTLASVSFVADAFSGGVTVTGANFLSSTDLRCVFTCAAPVPRRVPAPGTFLSATQVVCSVSSLAAIGCTSMTSLTVAVSNDLGVTSSAALPVPTAFSPTVASVSPSSGASAFDTVVTVVGSQLTSQSSCLFNGTLLVPLRSFVSAHEITCTLPAWQFPNQAQVSVAVINAVAPFASASVPFRLYLAPRLDAVSPAYATLSSLDTIALTVRGAGFTSPTSSYLTVNGVAVNATSIANSSFMTFALTPGVRGQTRLVPIQVSGVSLTFEAIPRVTIARIGSGTMLPTATLTLSTSPALGSQGTVTCAFTGPVTTSSSAATTVSSSAVSCALPDVYAGTVVNVTLLLDNAPYATNTLSLTLERLADAINVTSSWPALVTITGRGLAPPNVVQCRVRRGGSAPVNVSATVRSDATAQCAINGTALGWASGAVAVDVIVNGIRRNSTVVYAPALPPAVVSAYPLVGIPGTSTDIHLVFASAVADTSGAFCRFAVQTTAPVTFQSGTTASCPSPSSLPAGSAVQFQVILDSVATLDTNFTVYPMPTVSSVSPASPVPCDAYAFVSVSGSNLSPALPFTCLYTSSSSSSSASTSYSARVVSSSLLRCRLPSCNATTSITLAVACGAAQLFTAAIKQVATTVLYLSPATGPLGITQNVVLVGSGMVPGVQCEWDGAVITTPSPIFLNTTAVQCQAPPSLSPSSTVRLMNADGTLFNARTLVYRRTPVPALQRMVPSSGPVSGGTTLTLGGTNLTSASFCLFYATISSATPLATTPVAPVSSALATCPTPQSGLQVGVMFVALHSYGQALPFTVYAPTVVSAAASSAISPGTTDVVVQGANFMGTPSLSCLLNGVVVVPAVFNNASIVRCNVPEAVMTSANVTRVTLRVGNNGVDWSASYLVLSILATPPVVLSVWPVHVPAYIASGAAPIVITVTGAGFRSPTLCRFDRQTRTTVQASVVNSTTLTCQVTADGTTRVAVSTDNGLTFAESPVVLQRIAVPMVSVSPTAGALAGSDSIQVTGSGFVPGMQCRFAGTTVVPTTWLSSTSLTCWSPSAGSPSTVEVDLVVGGNVLGTAGAVFNYASLPTLSSVSPVSTWAGQTVTVTGTGFVDSPTLQCLFGGRVLARALFQSTTTVTCQAPMSEKVVGAVALQVGNDGVHWPTASLHVSVQPESIRGMTMSPVWAPSAGGTSVTITIAVLISRGDAVVACLFSADTYADTVPASNTTLSGSRFAILCVSPKMRTQARVTVQFVVRDVSGNQRVHPFEASFTYADLSVVSVTPNVATAQVTRTLTLRLANVPVVVPSPSRCFFDNGTVVTVPATSVASFAAQCQTPANLMPGLYRVGLQFPAGNIIPSQTVQLVLNPLPNVTNVHPLDGQTGGGETVYISGTGFAMSGEVQCRFTKGTSVVSAGARPLSPTQMACARPPLLPGTYRVSVSNDGVDFSTSQAFLYQVSLEATAVGVLAPAHGPVGGGTVVTLTGHNVTNSSSLRCRFHVDLQPDQLLPLTFVSTSVQTCTSPPTPFAAVATVDVVNVGVQSPYGSLTFTYDPVPIVTSASPVLFYAGTQGPALTIRGQNLLSPALQPNEVICRFNRTLGTTATVVRSNEIRCPSPASMAAGTYNLSISFNGQQYWPSGFTLAWRPQPAIVKLAPSLGPILGGTRVTVTVATPLFVADSVPVMCQFGSEPSSVGFVQNQTTVVCTSPSVASPGLVHVNVFYDVIGAGPNPPTVLFEYHAAVAAAQLFPSSSASSGGASAVFIKGPGVYNASLTRCIVVETQALLWTLVLSPNLILCHVPPGTTFPAPLQSSGIHIGLTHAPDLALPFTFTVPCPQGRMCVAGSEYPCPAGAKCTDHRTDGNFTACAPGTYQPEGGQSRCISCPAPFICPDYGTRTPVPCPPGFVCTVGSPADPAMLCPAGVVCAGNTLVPSLVQPAPTFALPSVAPRGTFYMYPFTGGDVASQIPSLCPNASYCVPGTAPGQQVPCELGANCGPGNFRPEGPGTPPGFYSPTPGTVLVPCPVGHYCPGLGNGVPIPCPRGSFAATTGNPVCVMCPAGSICPLSGMVQPLLCAPGLLCEGIGQQDEAQECPAGHFCQGGFATPCPPGTFCWEGVQTAQVAVWNFTFAQPCLAGTYCQEGSSDIYGSGFCQPGTYCPAGSTAPVAVVPGQYSMKVGNFRPLDCVPGTFSSTPNAAQCLSCPSGYKCPAFGMIRPVVCDRGYYRTQVDDVTCMPCPPGTWSDVLGLVDPSLCDPCPSGYVCGVTGMWQLSQATKCLEGYVCGQGTYPAIQFDALCPAGYACPAATTYSTMYEFLCPAGYICVEGTPYSLRDLYSCPKNRYCPLGTYRNKTGIDSNGRVVYEQLPLNSSIVRPGDLTTVWDKLWTVCATPTSPPGPAVTTEPCDFFTVRTPLPDGTVNVRYSQVCPLGTHSPVNSISIDNCTVIPNYGPATAFSPVDPSEVYDGIQLDIVGPVDYWVVNMEPLDTISINMNFSGIFTNLRYGVDWQVSIYEHEGATKRRRMPAGYGDPSLDKRSHLQLKILDTMPVHFTIRIEIINGRYLDAAMSFVNTTSLSRTWPNRAHFGTRDAFCMLLPITLGLELPLNLPRPDEDNFFIVDTTPPQYSLYYSSWNATPSVEVNPIVGDNFADVFVSLSHVQANNDDYFANPIMPYISQCRDFDSYAFFYQLFEHPNCTLVPPEETRPISAYQFGQSAVADRCDLVMDCIYEEPLSVSSTNPRWYQISHKEQPVFYITQTAVPYPTIAAGPQSLLGSLVPQLGNDYLVPVLASSLDPDSNTQKVPREVTFTVAYQQVDAYTKKIISAKLQFNSFDTNYSQSAYQFKVVMEPLQYTELVNNFAFGSDVYVILYLVIGTGLCAAGVVYWTIHKLTSRVKFKSRLLLSDFLRASEGPPLIALTLIAPPLLLAIVTLKFIFIDRNVFQGFSGTFTNFTPVDPLSPTGAQFESGRLTLALTALGMYLIGISSQMFIPRKVRRFRRFTADDHKQEQFEASVEEVHNAAEDESWAPRYWKRVHYISCCMLVSIVGVCMIEFSYSRFYFENTLAIIVVLKFMTPFINYGLRAMFKEALLVGPSQTMLGAIQFVMKMGAPDLTEFMIGFVTDVLLDTANVLYVVPLQVYLFEAVKKLLVRFRKAFNVHMKRRAVLAERERKRKLGLSVSDNLEEGLESGQEEEPEDDENDNDEVVEPLIDAYGDHVNTVIYLGLAPLTLTLLILFRTQTQIAITYSIKEDNLRYYLMFSAMIIPFVVVYNAFVVNILELFHGYRITAYLKYCQFAFQARDQRWCACETSMDMGIAEPLRSIHQMAFSSQYSLSVFVGACGMIMVAVGVEAEVRLNFNVFGDPVYPIVITIAFLIGIVIVKLCRFLADIVGLWRVRSRHSPRVKRDSKKMKITDWEEIEHMAAVAKMQLQAEMRRIETPRLLDSDFRDDFIKFNRVWLVLHLEEIVSPRNVRRDRSRALAQLGRVLLVGKTEKQQEVVVVSSDSSSGDEFEEALKAFKYAGINETGRKIGGGWLAIVRWRMRLRVHFRNIAEAWLDSHGCVCSHCGSRDTVQVESTPDMDHLVNRYHHMDEVTAPGSIDLSKWKNYLDSRAEFAAVCKRCIDEQEALRDALTRMSQPARTIAIMWLQTVRDILTKRKREADMKANATALSSDEDSADDYENVVKTAAKSITVSPISAQIYGLWLDMVRLMIIAKRREASGEWQQQAQSVVEASSSESDVEFAGLDAGDKNVVGPVSNITDQMIQYWLDGARLTIYQRQLDAIKATAGDAAAATSANDGGAQPSRAVAETNDGDGKTPEAESATLKGD